MTRLQSRPLRDGVTYGTIGVGEPYSRITGYLGGREGGVALTVKVFTGFYRDLLHVCVVYLTIREKLRKNYHLSIGEPRLS